MSDVSKTNELIAEALECCADKQFCQTYEAGLMRRLASALEVRQVDEAEVWDEGWAARASRGYAHLKVGESVPAPSHINPYRLGERHEPEPGGEGENE